jgi:hypothetical protein
MPPDLVANANLGTVTTTGEPLDGHVDKPKTVSTPTVVEKVTKVVGEPHGFVLIIGAVAIGGMNVSQGPSRDLSDIIRTKLAPQVEAATGKQWWAMPVYERRDALLQKAHEISATLSGFVTVDPSDGEAGPLARALVQYADVAFVANR